MIRAARAHRFTQAHRLLEAIFEAQPSILEPSLLVWAAQRRPTGPTLWWGSVERLRCSRMLCMALEHGSLDGATRHAAEHSLAAVQRVQELHLARHPIPRELDALQLNVAAWMAGEGGAAVGWERPSGTGTCPPHIRKMVRRYDALRNRLIKQVESEGGDSAQARGVAVDAPVALGESDIRDEAEPGGGASASAAGGGAMGAAAGMGGGSDGGGVAASADASDTASTVCQRC